MSSLNGPQGSGVSKDGANFGGGQNLPVSEQIKKEWASKTSAALLTESEFLSLKQERGLYIVGVTGFSGQWSEQKIASDQAISDDVTAATAAIIGILSQLKAVHGDLLLVSSGATMEGVPKIIYDQCAKLGINTMGVTSAKAFDYELGKMKYLIVQGADWGEESATFLSTSDEVLMIGGGGQAKREAIAASAEGKPVTILQGYKGTADQLTSADLPNAQFIARH